MKLCGRDLPRPAVELGGEVGTAIQATFCLFTQETQASRVQRTFGLGTKRGEGPAGRSLPPGADPTG